MKLPLHEFTHAHRAGWNEVCQVFKQHQDLPVAAARMLERVRELKHYAEEFIESTKARDNRMSYDLQDVQYAEGIIEALKEYAGTRQVPPLLTALNVSEFKFIHAISGQKLDNYHSIMLTPKWKLQAAMQNMAFDLPLLPEKLHRFAIKGWGGKEVELS